MDNNPDKATSSSSSSNSSRAVRISARVRAAKDKVRVIEEEPESVSGRITRSAKGKGKAESDLPQEPPRKKARRSAPGLLIHEPPKDRKGKRRAIDLSSDEEPSASSSSSAKRPRTSSYALRSLGTLSASTSRPMSDNNSLHPKSPTKSGIMSALPGPSNVGDESDVGVSDAVPTSSQPDAPVDPPIPPESAPKDSLADGSDDENDPDDDGPSSPDANTNPGIPGGMDEATALAMFGDYRQFGSFMVSLGARLKTMLTNIKPSVDPTTRLLALQELSELLSISTEDTLAGSFQVEPFVSELVKILGGRGTEEDEEDSGDNDDEPKDEDAALAAALAMSSGGGAFQGDENPEAQVLACRCLANLMEALPGVAHTVVYHGAIPVLCSKLLEISYIDLAEQTLSTMGKISEEFPSAIVREGGLAALLNYLDFFSIAVQRTALQAAANCCRNISADHFPMVDGVWPIIRNCLAYSDQRLVEYACLCIIRVIDSYHRSSTEHLETLVNIDTVRAINLLLLPAGGSPLIASNTFTLLLRALATAARSSAKVTVSLLEAGIVDTLYQILTGVLPSATADIEQGDSETGQGLGGGVADMAVMETLAHRTKDQVEETLSLINELMPPMPKDGVFDHKSYTEKALGKLVKAKAKAERAQARQDAKAAQAQLQAALLLAPPPSSTPTSGSGVSTPPITSEDGDAPLSETPTPPNDRVLQLRANSLIVGRFMTLIVPILIDVYAATVSVPLRIKTLNGILKATSYLDGEELQTVFKNVPIASFASSILSSKDHPSLVIGALQVVELLLSKNSPLFKPSFRREGVFHEIETIADRMLSSTKKEASDSSNPDADATPPPPPPAAVPYSSSLKKLSSLSLEPEDAITLRSRVIRLKFLSEKDKTEENTAFDQLKKLVIKLGKVDASQKDCVATLKSLADHFSSVHGSVSSFEMLQSGIVDAVLTFATDSKRKVPEATRRELLLNTLAPKGVPESKLPLALFVKKLQESLTRIESFEVVTVNQGVDDSKRSSPSLLARQIRLRLVADDNDADIPKGLNNIVVSIHAIATFQALHDYLRPRVAGIIGGSGSRLSGMLAALAASYGPGGIPRGNGGARPPPTEAPMVSAPAAQAGSSNLPSMGETESASAPVTRRRSKRLAKEKDSASSDEASEERKEQPPPTIPAESASRSATPPPPLPADGDAATAAAAAMMNLPMEEAQALVEAAAADMDDDMSEEEVDAFAGIDQGDRTVNLSVTEETDGSAPKVEAQTPDGTRVPTPAIPEASSSSLSNTTTTAPPRPSSYAAALKSKPTDWHIEFFMEDQELPLDLTIYGAIHQHESAKQTGGGAPVASQVWQGLYTVKFKKVQGPAKDPGLENDVSKSRASSPVTSLPENAPEAKILKLLRVLHQLNASSSLARDAQRLSESSFINNKLSAKLTRQLEEPMIVASACLPDWAQDLPQHFPFLFPFATRYNFLQSTSFGYARLIMKWQSQQQQSRSNDNSRRDDGIGFLGRLQRQKVRVSRKHILESAVKVFELYGSSSSILEVEYFDEVGTGLGPTLEFYSLVSKEFARKDLKIWRDNDANGETSIYVHHPQGLFPAPISAEDMVGEAGQKRTHLLRVIGQFVAKAMLDSRIIDLHFNKAFLQMILQEDVPVSIATLRMVDSELASSLSKLENMVTSSKPLSEKLRKLGMTADSMKIDDLALDFTVPGYDIELKPGGADIAVTSENAREYIQAVLDAVIGKGAQFQAKAFREGFSKVFNVADLQTFSSDELVMLFGNSDEDWSLEALTDAVKADHGFNIESRAIRRLLEVMSEYDAPTRRDYLQFITGSPKLPIGGFRGLNPPLTVVRKPHEAPLKADDYLPSVMTCVNYLKLPEYSTKDIMRDRLKTAVREGKSSFHLS